MLQRSRKFFANLISCVSHSKEDSIQSLVSLQVSSSVRSTLNQLVLLQPEQDCRSLTLVVEVEVGMVEALPLDQPVAENSLGKLRHRGGSPDGCIFITGHVYALIMSVSLIATATKEPMDLFLKRQK